MPNYCSRSSYLFMHNGIAFCFTLIYDLFVVKKQLNWRIKLGNYDRLGSELNTVLEFEPVPYLIMAVIVLTLALISSTSNCAVT